MSKELMQELLKSTPSNILDLYEVYFPPSQFSDSVLYNVSPELGSPSATDVTSAISYRTLRFFNDLNINSTEVIWQGNKYALFPCQASGFEYSGSGTLPTPEFVVANIGGLITALCLQLDSFLGTKVIRHRTMLKFLDAVNFSNGNSSADPLSEFPNEVYFVDRKVEETDDYVKFELASAIDITSIKLPKRTILQNLCFWSFKDSSCGYTGSTYSTCEKTLEACKARFGENNALPFGGFPGAGLLQY